MLASTILAAAVGFLASGSVASPITVPEDLQPIGIQERQIKTDCAPMKCQIRQYSYTASTTKSLQAIDACADFKKGCSEGILKKYSYKAADYDITQGCTDSKRRGLVTAYCTYTEKASKGLSAFSFTGEVAADQLNYVPVETCKKNSKPSQEVSKGFCKVEKPDNAHVRFSNAKA